MCMHASVSDNHFKSNFTFIFGWILMIILHLIKLPVFSKRPNCLCILEIGFVAISMAWLNTCLVLQLEL